MEKDEYDIRKDNLWANLFKSSKLYLPRRKIMTAAKRNKHLHGCS